MSSTFYFSKNVPLQKQTLEIIPRLQERVHMVWALYYTHEVTMNMAECITRLNCKEKVVKKWMEIVAIKERGPTLNGKCH